MRAAPPTTSIFTSHNSHPHMSNVIFTCAFSVMTVGRGHHFHDITSMCAWLANWESIAVCKWFCNVKATNLGLHDTSCLYLASALLQPIIHTTILFIAYVWQQMLTQFSAVSQTVCLMITTNNSHHILLYHICIIITTWRDCWCGNALMIPTGLQPVSV